MKMGPKGHWVFFVCFVTLIPFGSTKEEPLFSEYIPKDIQELQKISVAMNCVFDNYGNSSDIQECISCFVPFGNESLKCYETFFTENTITKCSMPKVEEITEQNKESIMFNLTTCVDYHLRVKTVDSCVKAMSVSQYQERSRLVDFIGSCLDKNMDILFREALQALEASPFGSVKAVCEEVLDEVYGIEILSKCEEVQDKNVKECKKCFVGAMKQEDVPMIFKDSLKCSNKHLNSAFGKCFISENFSGKDFNSTYGVKRAMGTCLHKNTDSVLKEICSYNLPGQYINSPEPQEVFGLISACMEYHHIKLHNIHYQPELQGKLKLHDQYIMAVDGITEEVKNFFEKIAIEEVKHED